jgi:hypothetical protein
MPELTDTSREAGKIQVQLLRNASPAERVARVRSLSESVIRLSRRAISRSKPLLSNQETKLEFISLHYGKRLAEKVKTYIMTIDKK